MTETQFKRQDITKFTSEEKGMYLVINNIVYDLTKYFKSHPGGKEVIFENAGKDATEKWLEAGHSPKAQNLMKRFEIGKIVAEEQIDFENPMHKGFFAQYFPYISILLTVALVYELTKLESSGFYEIFPFVLGIFPSLFLILSGIKLWTGHTFRFHRIGGLIFLIQYASSWYYFFTNYEWFKGSFLVWSLVLNGCVQALSAIIEIGHSLTKDDSGEYFGSKNATVSRDFIVENFYYQVLTAFSSLYYYPQFYDLFRSNIIGKVIEVVFVFLPFVLIRPLFPKTLLRVAVGNSDKNNSDDHQFFFVFSAWAIKFCVLFGKHYVGFFVNAVRYLGGLNTPEAERLLQFMMLANAGTVSISVFLHTLKFKSKLSPKVAMSIYLMILYTPVIPIYQLTPMCYVYWKLLIIFTIGLFINFADKKIQTIWTFGITTMFVAYHNGFLPQVEKLFMWK
jgi:predicted heme/steroid binding protein